MIPAVRRRSKPSRSTWRMAANPSMNTDPISGLWRRGNAHCAANRRDPSLTEPEFKSGDGGFSLMAETDLPIYERLGTQVGRSELGLSEHESLLKDAAIYQLRLRPGEDASCLNLYQPRKPKLLGVPREFIERGGFEFQATASGGKDKPWALLEGEAEPGVVPVFGDAAAVLWILHLGLGKDLPIQAETGEKVHLRISGMLKNSIFQGELLMSEINFVRLFPSQSGYRSFLIEPPRGKAVEVAAALEDGLAEYGFDAVRTGEKRASYLAVQNTYLSTFLAIGGLGLVLGTLGLGTVLLRNVLERRAELAMLRALGFRSAHLAALVLAENSFLLIIGLATGTGSALLAVTPHLLSGSAVVPWGSLVLTLVLVFAAGMLSGGVAMIATLRSPLLPALRGE